MKLKIQPLCVFYFLSIAVFSSIWTCVGAFLALLIHELAHLLAGYWLGEKAESVDFTGLRTVFPPGHTGSPDRRNN